MCFKAVTVKIKYGVIESRGSTLLTSIIVEEEEEEKRMEAKKRGDTVEREGSYHSSPS